jgi:hypothetical protein
MTALAAWQNFYVIVGASAGDLIGLQFVVLSLVANRPTTRVDAQTGGTFFDANDHSFLGRPYPRGVRNIGRLGRGSAIAAPRSPVRCRCRGALLLLIGIHNAWDAVMYHVFVKRQD